MSMTILPESPPPTTRRTSSGSPRLVIVAVGALLVVVVTAFWFLRPSHSTDSTDSSATTSATSHTSTGAPHSAADWWNAAMSAARAKGSVHMVVDNHVKGRTLHYSDDDAHGVGIQRITVTPGMHATVRVIGDRTYFMANRAALVGYFGFAPAQATLAADRWLLLGPQDPGYAAVTEAVAFESAMNQVRLAPPYTLLKPRSVHGVRVLGVRGRAAGPHTPGHKVSATVWIARADHLPVMYEASSPKLGTMKVTFSHWGQHVQVIAPAGAAPIIDVLTGRA